MLLCLLLQFVIFHYGQDTFFAIIPKSNHRYLFINSFDQTVQEKSNRFEKILELVLFQGEFCHSSGKITFCKITLFCFYLIL